MADRLEEVQTVNRKTPQKVLVIIKLNDKKRKENGMEKFSKYSRY